MLVQADGLVLLVAGLQAQHADPEPPRLRLQGLQQHPAQALAAVVGPDVHALQLGGARLEVAQRAASERIPFASRATRKTLMSAAVGFAPGSVS